MNEESCFTLRIYVMLFVTLSIEVDCRVVHQFETASIQHHRVVLVDLLPFGLAQFHLVVNALGAHTADVVEHL